MKLKGRILSGTLALMLMAQTIPIAKADDIGVNAESYIRQMEQAVSGAYKFDTNMSYGVRMSLYDAKTSQLLDTQNWLSKAPVCKDWIPLGTFTKPRSKDTIDFKTMFNYTVTSGIPETGSGGGKAWLEDAKTQEDIIVQFGKTKEEFMTAKYLIAVEPIQEMHIGSPEFTYIGTATEVATFSELIYPTASVTGDDLGIDASKSTEMQQALNLISTEIGVMADKGQSTTALEQLYSRLKIALLSATADTRKTPKFISDRMGNMTNAALPKSFTLSDPSKPNLGFSLVTNPPTFVTFSEIRGQGYGLGILFTSCKYQGKFTHGSLEARDPNHRPNGVEANEPPCTCDPKNYCPYHGTWEGKTTLPKDPYSGPSDLTKLTKEQLDLVAPNLPKNQDPAIDIDDGMHPHGSDEAVSAGCICPQKIIAVVPPAKGDPIKKDFLNQRYTSDEGSSGTDGEHESGPSGGLVSSNGSNSVLHGSCVESVSTSFLGDRGFTASPTNLIVSSAYNNKAGALSNVNGLTEAYNVDHREDRDSLTTATFNSASCTHKIPCSGCKTRGKGKNKEVYCPYGGWHRVGFSASIPSVTYTAEPTFFANSKSAVDRESMRQGHEYSKGSATNLYIPLGGQESVTFYPSYKMKYYNSPSSSASSIWMLASGERKFSYKPYVHVNVTQPKLDVLAPWSTDYEDIDNRLNTIKAGNAITLNSSPIDYTFDCYYYIQDEFYEDGQSRSYSTNSEYERAFNDLMNSFKDVHVFGNVPYTGDFDKFISNNLGVRANYPDEIMRKSLYNTGDYPETVTHSSVNKTITRSNFIGGIDSNSQSTLDGQSVNSLDSGIIMEMKPLIQKDPSGHSWYSEDYEGLIKVHLHGEFTVQPQKNKWFEVYRDISDWKSEANTRSNPIKIMGSTVYSGNNFVLGLGSYFQGDSYGAQSSGSKSYSAFNIGELGVYGTCEEFRIRGSAFDQH